jgi:hypothetical protein
MPLSAANIRNHLDALSQLRRFDPEAPVIVNVDGVLREVVLLNSAIDKETGRAVMILEAGPEVAR